jgi:hypothetical protein
VHVLDIIAQEFIIPLSNQKVPPTTQMAEIFMLKQPNLPYPQTDGNSYVCVDDGRYYAYLDHDAAVVLLHSLQWFYDQPPGEEIDIRSSHWESVPHRGQRIGYCEFNLVPAHVQKKVGKNIRQEARPTVRYKPHGLYSPEHDRLDYFVSPEEVKAAYEALTLLVENVESREGQHAVTLFDTLVVHLVSS